jgi:hypothetical protein
MQKAPCREDGWLTSRGSRSSLIGGISLDRPCAVVAER